MGGLQDAHHGVHLGPVQPAADSGGPGHGIVQPDAPKLDIGPRTVHSGFHGGFEISPGLLIIAEWRIRRARERRETAPDRGPRCP